MITYCKAFSLSISFNLLFHNLRIYSPSPFSYSGVFWFSRKCDFFTLQPTSYLTKRARVDGAYKHKHQKIHTLENKTWQVPGF